MGLQMQPLKVSKMKFFVKLNIASVHLHYSSVCNYMIINYFLHCFL